jgi:hypothetical protein
MVALKMVLTKKVKNSFDNTHFFHINVSTLTGNKQFIKIINTQEDVKKLEYKRKKNYTNKMFNRV